MTNKAVKAELIEWLTKLDNSEILRFLKDFKDLMTLQEDSPEYLTDEQKAGIERGLKDIDEARVISHEHVKKHFGL